MVSLVNFLFIYLQFCCSASTSSACQLDLIISESHFDSRWPPRLSILIKHKIGLKSTNSTNILLKFVVVVAESPNWLYYNCLKTWPVSKRSHEPIFVVIVAERRAAQFIKNCHRDNSLCNCYFFKVCFAQIFTFMPFLYHTEAWSIWTNQMERFTYLANEINLYTLDARPLYRHGWMANNWASLVTMAESIFLFLKIFLILSSPSWKSTHFKN